MNAADSNAPMQSKLSPAEVASLAAGVAGLTKSGMPLPAGLRAWGAELPGQRLRRATREMADRLDRGDSLEDVLNYSAGNLPPHFHGLLIAGLRTGRLPEVMEEYVQIEEKQQHLRQRLRLSLAYPIVLMVILTVLVFGFEHYLLSTFSKIFRDFGTSLPTITAVFFAAFKYLQWVMVGLVLLLVAIPFLISDAPGLGWLSPAVYYIPLVGTLLKYSRWAMFSRLTALLLEQQTPLPRALSMIAAGLRDPYLAWACRQSAQEVESGCALSESMRQNRSFPRSLIPFVEWGEKANALPEAFASANQLYEGRAQSQTASLSAIFLPILFLLIVLIAGLTVISIMMPLISLVTSLTGGGHR